MFCKLQKKINSNQIQIKVADIWRHVFLISLIFSLSRYFSLQITILNSPMTFMHLAKVAQHWHIYSSAQSGIWAMPCYTVRIKKEVIHIQRPIGLKSINLNIYMWHTSKEQLILFPLVPFLHHECHAWPSTLPLKMTVSYPTFCKFSESDKKLPNSAMVWLQRSPHLMPGDHFLSGILNDNVLATSPCDPEDHIRAYLTWINGCSSCLGNYLAMESQDMQDMLHRCQLCVEIRSG